MIKIQINNSVTLKINLMFQSFSNGDLKIEFISIIIGAITMSSVPCYYSGMLMESVSRFFFAVTWVGS